MKCNLRFPLEVGALYRNQIRRAFDKMKFDLQDRDPEAIVSITESKSFFDSIFYVSISNIEEGYARNIETSVKGWVEILNG